MLIVGEVGWGNLHPTRLTPDEQYTHISLWCLLASPLLIGCDMEKLDDFTLSLLTNDEVLAVDQDPLGKQATCVIKDGHLRVYAKDWKTAAAPWVSSTSGTETGGNCLSRTSAKLNLSGKQTVRDLWRQKDIATMDTAKDSLPLTIPAHGVLLYKFTTAECSTALPLKSPAALNSNDHIFNHRPRRSLVFRLTILALLLVPLAGRTQEPSKARPPFVEARWIGFGDPAVDHVDSRFAFRKRLELAAKPTDGRVRVTADARYILWVNGMFVGRGPARGFPWAQPYDEFDLAPFLQPGPNWIAAEVYQFGPGQGAFGLGTRGNGVYVSTGRSGLLIEGEAVLPNARCCQSARTRLGRRDVPSGMFPPLRHTCTAASGSRNAWMPDEKPSGWRCGARLRWLAESVPSCDAGRCALDGL